MPPDAVVSRAILLLFAVVWPVMLSVAGVSLAATSASSAVDSALPVAPWSPASSSLGAPSKPLSEVVRHVLPGGTVPFVWRADQAGQNASYDRSFLPLHPVVVLPAGWDVLLPPPVLVTDGDFDAVQTMVLLVAPDAPPGDYKVSVCYDSAPNDSTLRSPKACASNDSTLHSPNAGAPKDSTPRPQNPSSSLPSVQWTVRVGALDDVHVIPVHAPVYNFGDPYTISWRVRNAGNRAGQFVFSVTDNLAVPITVIPSQAHLAPDESVIVTAHVGPFQALGTAQIHHLRFHVQYGHAGDLNRSMPQAVELIPRTLHEGRAHQLFPLRLRWSGWWMGGLAAGKSPVVRWAVQGSTQFGREAGRTDGGPFVSVVWDDNRAYVSWQDDHHRLVWGDQYGRLSPLSERGRWGTGIGLDWTAPDDRWRATVFALQPSRRPLPTDQLDSDGFGAGVTYALTPGVDVAARVASDGAIAGYVGTVGASMRFNSGWHMDTEFGRHGGGAAVGADRALAGAQERSLPKAHRLLVGYDGKHRGMSLEWESEQAGYRGRPDHSHRWRLSQRGVLGDNLRWQWRYRHEVEQSTSHRTVHKETTIRLWGRWHHAYWTGLYMTAAKGPGGGLRHRSDTISFSWQERPADGGGWMYTGRWHQQTDDVSGEERTDASHAIRYVLATPRGKITPSWRLRTWEQKGGAAHRTTDISIRYDYQFNDAATVAVTAGVQNKGQPLWHASVEAQVDLSSDTRIEARGWVYMTRGVEPDVGIRVGVSVPLTVSLGRRHDVAQLSGRITDGNGVPLRDVIVRLGDQRVATTADGTYRFAAVTSGVHYLTVTVPSASGPDVPVTVPPTPLKFVAEPGMAAEQNFQVVAPASVTGTVTVMAADVPLYAGGAEPNLALALRQGDIVHRHVMSASDSTFAFRGLQPGPWQLMVDLGGLSHRYDVAVEPEIVNVPPGDNAHVEVTLRPVSRVIQWIQGGEVVVEP